MAKILNATCDVLGVVTVDGTKVPTAVVLSQGKQASSGLALMEADKVTYVTSNADDLKTALEKISSIVDDVSNALSTIATTLTAIGTGMTGATTAPPATLATSVASINSKATDLAALKAQVDSLKGALK